MHHYRALVLGPLPVGETLESKTLVWTAAKYHLPKRLRSFYRETRQSLPCPQKTGWINSSDGSVSGRERHTLDALFRPEGSLHLAVISVFMLNQVERDAALSGTLKAFKINVGYLPNTPARSDG